MGRMADGRSQEPLWGAQLGFRLGSSEEIMGAREMHVYASAGDLVLGQDGGRSWSWALGLTAGLCVGFMRTVVPGFTPERCVFVPAGGAGGGNESGS